MWWQRFVLGFSLAINVILVYSLIWSDQGLRAYRSLKRQYASLELRIKELDDKNLALSREIRLIQSDEKYMEKILRQRLNFVRDNEILYIFPDAHDAARTGAGADEAKN